MSQRASKPYKVKPGNVEQTSSPAKVYHSRASKPSSVQPLAADAAAGTDAILIDNLNAKVDELIAALKK